VTVKIQKELLVTPTFLATDVRGGGRHASQLQKGLAGFSYFSAG
jgi:hypothetical protein